MNQPDQLLVADVFGIEPTSEGDFSVRCRQLCYDRAGNRMERRVPEKESGSSRLSRFDAGSIREESTPRACLRRFEWSGTFVQPPRPGDFLEFRQERYYLTALEIASGSGRAVGRRVDNQLLECHGEERFEGFDLFGKGRAVRQESALYAVSLEHLGEFCGICGKQAGWTQENLIVTHVDPVAISPWEYRVTVQARDAFAPELFQKYDLDRADDPTSQHSIRQELIDCPAGAEFYTANSNGASSGPLECPEQLHSRYATRGFKLSRITECVTRRMSEEEVQLLLEEWSMERVFEGRCGGVEGSFLRREISVEPVFDSLGEKFYRIRMVCDRAPGNFRWNRCYWNLDAALF
ncbi:MAG: hypothetical protein PHS41_07335 [Victivallaceae bacterium]|nr:hypothetical protein [Victivallaceae bacterium]